MLFLYTARREYGTEDTHSDPVSNMHRERRSVIVSEVLVGERRDVIAIEAG